MYKVVLEEKDGQTTRWYNVINMFGFFKQLYKNNIYQNLIRLG